MKRFRKPPLDDCKALIEMLRGKTVEEITAMFGPAVREHGPERSERTANGEAWVVAFRRSLMFRDVTPTIHRLAVFELTDGKLEFSMQGAEITDEHTTA